ncbi:hypothetical protein Tco_1558612, partial [Tanacetum coccineum]
FAFVYFEDELMLKMPLIPLTILRFNMTGASSQLNGLGVNTIDTVIDPSLCQGALGEIMADEVIVLLGGQLVPIGEVDQALCFNRRRGDQIREMDLNLHPELKESLIKLCNDPQTTIVFLSGSDRTILDDVYS